MDSTTLFSDSKEFVITGSTGGVGSISVLLLSNLGYDVVASTGKYSETDFLKGLGAKEIIELISKRTFFVLDILLKLIILYT